MATNIKVWQQTNTFALTLRGHDKYIPLATPTISDETVSANPYLDPTIEIQNLLQAREGNTNYNTLFDSFFMPTDCRLSAICIRLPEQLPLEANYTISFKLNGTEVELFAIPEMEDSNLKIYSTGCDLTVWEDDFVEIDVQIDSDTWKKLSWNNHNVVVSISGNVLYSEYAKLSNEYSTEIGWELGDSYYPTSITLQNRSGNDIFKNRVFADVVKSSVSFMLQEVRLSMFEDYLMTSARFPRPYNCFFVDILVNGKNIASTLGLPYPTPMDILNNSLRAYNSSLNKSQGYPVLISDDLMVRIYTQNITARYNGKILEVLLIGCSSDSLSEIIDSVSVYELCAVSEPCTAKFSVTKPCVPVKEKKSFNFVCDVVEPS